ncbi:MAG: CRTAC1 family protein [Planctomycetota bacterium]|nr:MAG: CRTAC1 family protein [Planctomycetota bacterium]REK45972.1 MAG: CRTAC1 family protein [Planctomycetota bacterium]
MTSQGALPGSASVLVLRSAAKQLVSNSIRIPMTHLEPSRCRNLAGVGLVLVVAMLGCQQADRGGGEPAAGNRDLEATPLATAPLETVSHEVAAPAETEAGHERMRAVLQDIAERTADENPFLGDRQLRQLRKRIESFADDPQVHVGRKWRTLYNAGQLELRQGREAEAIALLKQALELAPQVTFKPSAEKLSHLQLGIAHMRLGETENCCSQHNSDSCILPIRGGGIHTREEGSRNAIKHFMAVLSMPAAADARQERLEVDEGARWLMNVAYMTLDEWPDKVPEEYRVGEEYFASTLEFPRFVNVYPRFGLSTFNLSGGAIVDDLDGDADLDVLTCSWDTQGQTQVFRNLGNGKFVECTAESGLVGFYGGLNLNQADYDNDGDLDIYINRGAWLKSNGYHPNSLLRNDGNLQFTDVTFAAGLAEPFLPTKTSCWADYDNDGDLDLYVGNESSRGVVAPCQLFRNNGDGTFTDVAAEAGVADEVFSMGAVWGDYNGDRYPDLYLSLMGPNKLYRNNGDGTFTDVAEELGVWEPQASFPTWFWDFDNDGHLDIFASASSGPVGVLDSDFRFEMMKLYRNQGDGTFRDVAAERKLTYPAQPMGANFGDVNTDGYPDFYLATGNVDYSELRPNVMFCSEGAERFHNVTMAGGFGHLQKGHGVAFADIDNDGDQDVYVQMGGAYPGDKFNDALFENPGFGHHWIMIDLVGTQSNRSAIGAQIHVRISEEGTTRSIRHLVSSGSSFGANPLDQTIGLGRAEKIVSLEVYWPTSDTRQTFDDVPIDQAIQIREGIDKFTVIERPQFEIGR